MEQLSLISAADELGRLIDNFKDTAKDDAKVIVVSVIETLQQAIGVTNYNDLVKAALNDYLSNGLLDINKAAQNHNVYVGDVRVAFAKHLEERYSA